MNRLLHLTEFEAKPMVTENYVNLDLDFRKLVMVIRDCDFETLIKVLAKYHTHVKHSCHHQTKLSGSFSDGNTG